MKSLCNTGYTAHVIKEARLRPIEIVACSNPSYTWRQLKCHVVMPDGTKQQLGRPPRKDTNELVCCMYQNNSESPFGKENTSLRKQAF